MLKRLYTTTVDNYREICCVNESRLNRICNKITRNSTFTCVQYCVLMTYATHFPCAREVEPNGSIVSPSLSVFSFLSSAFHRSWRSLGSAKLRYCFPNLTIRRRKNWQDIKQKNEINVPEHWCESWRAARKLMFFHYLSPKCPPYSFLSVPLASPDFESGWE